VLLQGFFSGSEIALVNADKLKLRHRARQGHAGSRMVLKQFEHPERLLTTTLVGTNISTVSIATLATVMTIRHVGQGGDVIAILVIAPIMLIFGEVVPKSVYQQKADELAPILIYPLRFFTGLFFPIILIFSWFARLAVLVVSRKGGAQNVFVSKEKIRTLLESAEEAPSGGIFDHKRIKRAIRFSDITAGEIMIPLSDAVILNSSQSLGHAVALVHEKGYNRLPVYDTDASRIIGILILTTWDLLDPELTQRSLTDFLHPAMYVAPSQQADELLPQLQSRKDNMAVVVDEYGSAIGLLTSEDILEEVVGDIEDVDFRLHHHHKHDIEEIGDGVYLAEAHVTISDLNDQLNLHLPTKEFMTIGGLLVTRLRRIPGESDYVEEAGHRFTVVECDERMVKKVRIEARS
jgi:CBS domain containing-hemolysin-like protein